MVYCLQVKQTMAYAREQQDSNPCFQTFVQVGAPGEGTGGSLALGPKAGSCLHGARRKLASS